MGAQRKSQPPAPEPANDAGGGERGSHESPVQLTPAQEELVNVGLPMVKKCAQTVASRYHDLVTPEDLLAPGTFGLREAARTYRADRHPDFPRYARHHVRGRMIEAICRDHFSMRRRVEISMDRAYELFASQHTLGAAPATASDEKIVDGARQGCDDMLAAAHLAACTEQEQIGSQEDKITLRISMRDAVASLTPEEQAIVRRVYYEGMTLDEAAAKESIHLNTAKRRNARALRKLREALVGEDDGDDPDDE
jgi:RNA polymerase sigma factor (sigma-70 family)